MNACKFPSKENNSRDARNFVQFKNDLDTT